MLALDYIDPAHLRLLPPAVRQVRFEHVVLVALIRKLEARRAVLGQEVVGACCGVFFRHEHVGALVALVLCMPTDGSDGAVEVHLQDAGVPQRVVDGIAGNAGVARDQVAVPRGQLGLASRQHREGQAVVEVLLPMSEVED